jgi:hypothetical protein
MSRRQISFALSILSLAFLLAAIGQIAIAAAAS